MAELPALLKEPFPPRTKHLLVWMFDNYGLKALLGFINNLPLDEYCDLAHSPYTPLTSAFSWSSTPEGGDYWLRIYKEYRHFETQNNPANIYNMEDDDDE